MPAPSLTRFCLAAMRRAKIRRKRISRPLLLVTAAVFLGCAGQLAQAENSTVSPVAAHRASVAKDLLLIDVRSEREWRATGLPDSAVAITIHQPGGSRAFYEAVLQVAGGDKGRPIALICAAGVRSHRAMQILSSAGFSNLSNVAEGMEGSTYGSGWRRRGLPVSPWRPTMAPAN